MSFRPPRAEALLIDGPAGVLEALLEEPQPQGPQRSVPAGFAVICHPHPLHGGTLHNKVVHTLARACQERDLPTLRFNYRGVGASTGSYDEGRGETEDALAVVAAGRARWPHGALTLAGFSFGAMVSLRAAAATAPARLISVAPAVMSAGSDSIIRPPCPWLIVQGDADEVVDCRAVQAFAARFQPPPQLVVLPGAGHFFHRRLPELRDAAFEFLAATESAATARLETKKPGKA
ncbi:MAG: alpha/beta hydrolase [Steroidobacterales bacterium]